MSYFCNLYSYQHGTFTSGYGNLEDAVAAGPKHNFGNGFCGWLGVMEFENFHCDKVLNFYPKVEDEYGLYFEVILRPVCKGEVYLEDGGEQIWYTDAPSSSAVPVITKKWRVKIEKAPAVVTGA